MKSITLNSEIRQAILYNIATAYDKANPKPELTIDTKSILEKAVRTHYLKQSLTLRKLVEENPELQGAMSTRNYIRYITPNSDWAEIRTEENEVFYSKYADTTRDFRNTEYLAKNPSLKKAAEEFTSLQKAARLERQAVNTWENERAKYLDEIMQVLKGVRTTKQLIEQWEEVKEYIPQAYFNPSKIALPAINTAALNSKLGK
ncbi:hypothetical protein AVV30_gp064 [Vibrio phage phi 1]|uniref:Nucleotide modification associated domain-containing protein n=1 Tax=Vibrio phage phi 1 TaxID=1589297 RepID=A0A0B5H2N1_9CAUD|nr:hypothetical protein AVV30_gp064 [Vibrio phage phi 1]AJF40722.1 hypothetical protein SBVP1_0064 [Vibrio phage phi 1]